MLCGAQARPRPHRCGRRSALHGRRIRPTALPAARLLSWQFPTRLRTFVMVAQLRCFEQFGVMDTDPFASRLAVLVRLPVVVVGAASLVLSVANLLDRVDDQVIVVAGVVVGAAAVAMFLFAVFDMRFQRAVSALNAERRTQAKKLGGMSRVTGWGLPPGDRVLVAIALPLLAIALVAANYFHRLPATALPFAAFALTMVVQIGLMARGHPTDRRSNPLA